jgi:hypothetical protein
LVWSPVVIQAWTGVAALALGLIAASSVAIAPSWRSGWVSGIFASPLLWCQAGFRGKLETLPNLLATNITLADAGTGLLEEKK